MLQVTHHSRQWVVKHEQQGRDYDLVTANGKNIPIYWCRAGHDAVFDDKPADVIGVSLVHNVTPDILKAMALAALETLVSLQLNRDQVTDNACMDAVRALEKEMGEITATSKEHTNAPAQAEIIPAIESNNNPEFIAESNSPLGEASEYAGPF